MPVGLPAKHDPRPLENGHLLIFDNGPHGRDHPAPYSRVVEVDPRTSTIVWATRLKRPLARDRWSRLLTSKTGQRRTAASVRLLPQRCRVESLPLRPT